ncbi:RNA polymerase sigma factor [Tunturiibacter gelidoferens]|uniref:RNA polymerase sigma factor n=1 Tax=Tunturiibacter gelidiferens TaxID=3069689 RepID=A0AAU7Z0Q5_9BACT
MEVPESKLFFDSNRMSAGASPERGQNQRCLFHYESDESLVAAAKQGFHIAFEVISNRHSRRVFNTVYRITKNREDAEDACQDAALKAFLHLKTFDERSLFSTWLTRIAINSALMILRQKRRRNETSIDAHLDGNAWGSLDIPDPGKDVELCYLERDREVRLRTAVNRLSPVLRDVLEIRLSSDGSIKEIAQEAGISVAAAKSRLIRGRQALGRYINERDAKPVF